MSEIVLYHGSTKVIERPEFGVGNKRNDYGLGFYCTEDEELASEWACSTRTGGFVNKYALQIGELTVLQLGAPEYGVLDWLAILVNNRVFSIDSPILAEGKEYLTKHFLTEVGRFDAIKGYRADDSYFTFAMDFLNNTISLRQLSSAIRLGLLGEQFVLKSQKAFDSLRFLCGAPADGEIYYTKRSIRDSEARDQYLKHERVAPRQADDMFMIDILRMEVKRGDTRLQRNLSE